MKRANISQNVIRRLPRYLRKLDDLAYHGYERISSGELGQQMGLTPSQIRQDFSCFGEFGQQGYGYNIASLRKHICNILGMDRNYTAIVVGVGNLGHALMGNFGFGQMGFKLIAGFDTNPNLIGQTYADVPVLDVSELGEFLQENHVDIAALTVPRRFAASTAKILTENGVKAIWNFTNIDLEIEDPDVLVEHIHFSDSLLALSYYLSEKYDEEVEAKGE